MSAEQGSLLLVLPVVIRLATSWRQIVALRCRLTRASDGQQRRVREPRAALDRPPVAVAEVAPEKPTLGGGFRLCARVYCLLGQTCPRVAFCRSGLAPEPELWNTLQRRRCAAKARASALRGLVPLGASADCGTDFRFAVFEEQLQGERYGSYTTLLHGRALTDYLRSIQQESE